MNRFLRFLACFATTSIIFGGIMLVIQTSLDLFFKTTETIDNLSLDYLRTLFLKNISIVALVLLVLFPLRYFSLKKPTIIIDKPSPALSPFTKAIIIFPGLPLLGLMLSMIVVRLFEILSISVDPKLSVTVFVLFFWGYGIYKCKTIYFKNDKF